MTIRAWIAAARPLAHANIAPPLLLGQAFALGQGRRLDVTLALLAFGFGLIDHLVIVFTNDWADREADAKNDAPTPFSGGSRVIQRGLIDAAKIRLAAIASSVALLGYAGVVAWLYGRPLLPLFALVAIGLIVIYSVRPFALSYRGYGELLQGLGVGLVLPLTGYYFQTGSLEGTPWTAFAPLVLVGFASNILTALPDTEGDRAADKRSWPVRRGEPAARRDALVLMGVSLLLAAAADPPLEPLLDGLVVGPAAFALLAAFTQLKRADSSNREVCLRFVLLAAGAGGLLHLSWSGALWLSAGS